MLLSVRLFILAVLALSWVLLAQPLAIVASPEVTEKARQFIKGHDTRIKHLDVAAGLAWWNANTSGKPEDFALAGVYEQYKPNGIWIVNLSPNEQKLVALSTTCTHLGCRTRYNTESNLIECPCHGGVYDTNGQVIGGPPPKPLARLAARIDGDRVMVEM